MAALTFVDTNVFAYAYDRGAGAKCTRAREVLQGIDRAVVSTQVLLEFYAVLTRKLGVEASTARDAVEGLLGFEVVATDARAVMDAIELSIDHGISHWDALVVLAAARSGCQTLLTEDLNHGQVIEGVRVVDPFAVH